MLAAGGPGLGDDVGALPPTAAAQPPPLDTAGVVGLASSAGSAATVATEGPSPFQALPPPVVGGFEESDAPQPPESADALPAGGACRMQHSGGKSGEETDQGKTKKRERERDIEIEGATFRSLWLGLESLDIPESNQ